MSAFYTHQLQPNAVHNHCGHCGALFSPTQHCAIHGMKSTQLCIGVFRRINFHHGDASHKMHPAFILLDTVVQYGSLL